MERKQVPSEVVIPSSIAAHPSGAPQYGGATSRGSKFGGRGWEAAALRFTARIGRLLSGFAYRMLRDLERRQALPTTVADKAGRPRRAQEAGWLPSQHHRVHVTPPEQPSPF